MNHHRIPAGSVFLLLCLGFLAGCDGGDDPGDPQPIAGTSALTVYNPTDEDHTVYFGSVFIGRVQERSARTWTVPEGTHSVTVDNAERDQTREYTGSYFFEPGKALVLRIEEDEQGVQLHVD